MRLRNLLAATAVSALVVGAAGSPAHSTTAPSPVEAGTVITWGGDWDPSTAAAMAVPGDLTAPVRSVAASEYATGVVTIDGQARVWGAAEASEVAEAPVGINDATAIALTIDNGALLHADGHVTAWGSSSELSGVPSGLRAKAIALQSGTGYAVRPDGTLATWGATPSYPTPSDLVDLVDISVSADRALALHADGTVSIWGFDDLHGPLVVPDFGGKKVTEIASGLGYSEVVLEDGSLRTWGNGVPGEPPLDGTSPGTKVVAISASATTRVAGAVTADGALYVWGGNNPMTGVFLARDEKLVSAIALGENHAAAIVTAFRVITQPTVSGTAAVGETLTATPATLSLTPDAPATGQWYADNDPIAGKTGTTLTLETSMVGKAISYRTTAARGDDTLTAVSATVGPVPRVASGVTVSVSPAWAAAGGTRVVTATVAAPHGTPTGAVTFTVGTTSSVATLVGGTAAWTLPAPAVGSHAVTASYAGDNAFAPSTSGASTLTVTKATSKVSGKAKVTGKTRKVAKKVTLSLTVTSAQGVSAAGKVSVKLTGATRKTVTASVNAAGKATLTYKSVKRGRYLVKLTYAGNQNVAGSTGSVRFKV